MSRPAAATPASVKSARTSGGLPHPRTSVSSRRTSVAATSSSLRLRKNATFRHLVSWFPGRIPLGATSVTACGLRGEVAAACVEATGVELGPESLEGRLAIAREDVLDDVHFPVVAEGH